eukprot:4944866-Alexandrium_andersonii.AAC.1
MLPVPTEPRRLRPKVNGRRADQLWALPEAKAPEGAEPAGNQPWPPPEAKAPRALSRPRGSLQP